MVWKLVLFGFENLLVEYEKKKETWKNCEYWPFFELQTSDTEIRWWMKQTLTPRIFIAAGIWWSCVGAKGILYIVAYMQKISKMRRTFHVKNMQDLIWSY